MGYEELAMVLEKCEKEKCWCGAVVDVGVGSVWEIQIQSEHKQHANIPDGRWCLWGHWSRDREC